MITPIRVLTIEQICERKYDLLISDEDIKEMARNVRNKAIDDVFNYLKSKRDKRYMKICFDDLEIRQYKEQLKAGGK